MGWADPAGPAIGNDAPDVRDVPGSALGITDEVVVLAVDAQSAVAAAAPDVVVAVLRPVVELLASVVGAAHPVVALAAASVVEVPASVVKVPASVVEVRSDVVAPGSVDEVGEASLPGHKVVEVDEGVVVEPEPTRVLEVEVDVDEVLDEDDVVVPQSLAAARAPLAPGPDANAAATSSTVAIRVNSRLESMGVAPSFRSL